MGSGSPRRPRRADAYLLLAKIQNKSAAVWFNEALSLCLMSEQRFDFSTQFFIASAGLLQEGSPLAGYLLQSRAQ
jgi:hypothetical protein